MSQGSENTGRSTCVIIIISTDETDHLTSGDSSAYVYMQIYA